MIFTMPQVIEVEIFIPMFLGIKSHRVSMDYLPTVKGEQWRHEQEEM